MDRLDRRLQPSHFAQLTVWPGTSASFHAATRAEPRVPGPGWLVMAGPGQFKRLKAAQLDEAPVVQIPGQAHISELTALVKTPLTRMQYAPGDECGAYATQHWKPRAEPPLSPTRIWVSSL